MRAEHSGYRVLGAVHRDDTERLISLLENEMYHDNADLARALAMAAEKGYEDCALILLDAGASPDTHDASGATPLTKSAQRGHSNIVKVLVDANCRINKATFHIRATALHWASTNGHADCARILLENGADGDLTTIHGRTPLMLASRSDEEDVVQLLLENGVDVSKKDFEGATALHLAVEEGSQYCTELLLYAGADVNATTRNGDTPLIFAAHKGNHKVMHILMSDALLDLDKKGHKLTAMHWAAIGGSTKCIDLLRDAGMDPDEATTDSFFGGSLVVDRGITPIMLAAESGQVDAVRRFLYLGAKIDAVDDEGKTPLVYAIRKQHRDCIQLLLDNGADPDGAFMVTDDEKLERGISPIFYAIKQDNRSTIQMLLKANCDLSVLGYVKQASYVNPLEYAFSKNKLDVARLLIVAGADLHRMNKEFVDEPLAIALANDEMEFNRMASQLIKPLSLLQLTRNRIRKRGKRPMSEWIAKLPLPTVLKNYLDLKDFEDM